MRKHVVGLPLRSNEPKSRHLFSSILSPLNVKQNMQNKPYSEYFLLSQRRGQKLKVQRQPMASRKRFQNGHAV